MSEQMEQPAVSMKIKSYFSSSVEKAIQEAREEMGPEAMLLTTRRSSRQTRHLGAYEVVFGLPAASAAAPSVSSTSDLSSELQSLHAQLEEVKSALHVSGVRASEPAASSSVSEELYRDLLEADLERDLARKVAEEAVDAWRQTQPSPASLRGAGMLRRVAIESLSKRLRFAPEFAQQPQESGRLVIFVGPPGAGKTSTIAKFAVQHCLAAQRSVRIISVDPHRVASHEKLRALAGVIGVGFTPANTISEFVEALREFRTKNVILVDTPGYGGRDFEGAQDISRCLASAVLKEIHLILPASMKRADLARYVRQYELFQPDYLLFTKLDEAESCGAALSAAIAANKPLSFFSNGQTIPEDLEPARSGPLIAYLSLREAGTREPAEAVTAA